MDDGAQGVEFKAVYQLKGCVSKPKGSNVAVYRCEHSATKQRRGVKLTQRSWNGGTALHEAARTGDGNVVDWCVSAHTFCTPTLPQPTPEPTPPPCSALHLRAR